MGIEMRPEFILNVLRRQCSRGSQAFKKLSLIFDALYLVKCENNGYTLSEEELFRLPDAHKVIDGKGDNILALANEQFDIISQVSEGLSVLAQTSPALFNEGDIDG